MQSFSHDIQVQGVRFSELCRQISQLSSRVKVMENKLTHQNTKLSDMTRQNQRLCEENTDLKCRLKELEDAFFFAPNGPHHQSVREKLSDGSYWKEVYGEDDKHQKKD